MANQIITTLLKAWRETLEPKVGLLLETHATSHALPLEELPMKKGERAARLAQLAKGASDEDRTPVLLAFESFARDASGALVWPAVEAWAEVEPDPRVARMALRTLIALEHLLTGKLWRRLVGCVERHGDAGVAQEAAAYLATLERSSGWGFSSERFTNVLRRLSERKGKKPLAPAELEKLEQLARKTSTAPGLDDRAQEAQMLEAIVAHPADDGPRAVYADWLLERRLPRGEFISLQLNRATAKAAQRKREAQLLASHRGALLGPFDGVVAVSGALFERGFLVEAVTAKELPVTPLTRLLRKVRFKGAVGKEVDLSGLEEAAISDRALSGLLSQTPNLKRLTVQLRWYQDGQLKGLRLTKNLEALTVDAARTMLELTRVGEGWRLLVEPQGSWATGPVAVMAELLDTVKVAPAITVRCTTAQRRVFEPAVTAALPKQAASVTWVRSS